MERKVVIVKHEIKSKICNIFGVSYPTLKIILSGYYCPKKSSNQKHKHRYKEILEYAQNTEGAKVIFYKE